MVMRCGSLAARAVNQDVKGVCKSPSWTLSPCCPRTRKLWPRSFILSSLTLSQRFKHKSESFDASYQRPNLKSYVSSASDSERSKSSRQRLNDNAIMGFRTHDTLEFDMAIICKPYLPIVHVLGRAVGAKTQPCLTYIRSMDWGYKLSYYLPRYCTLREFTASCKSIKSGRLRTL